MNFMIFDRTKNSKRNIIWGLFSKICAIILPFIMRTVIIYTLGNLYLGLGSLFTSILNALNLAELGVGSALVFSMYKPIVENDKEKIMALFNLYKIIYIVIGCIVLTLGIFILPFLDLFIKGSYPSDINIMYIYVMQLFTTVSGYFFMAYKGSLLQAYQRSDIINKLTIVSQFLMYLLQIFALIVYKNYYLYVFAQFLQIIVFNILQSIIVKKMFPDIKPQGKLSISDKKAISKKTMALMGHKVAGMIINSVDSIFISMFMGLEMVAIYNNYFYIITALSGIFLMLTSGLNAIIGNYLIEESQSKVQKLFNTLHYIVSLLICFCCTNLLVLMQPFMDVWVGNMKLSFSSVILFSIYFFVVKIRTISILFKDSAGLWERDLIKAWLQIIINLVIDIWLLTSIGINGAIISTIVSMIFAFIYETYVIFKYCLKSSSKRYFKMTGVYGVLTTISCVSAYIVCDFLLDLNKWIKLPVYFFIASIISISTFIIGTIKTAEAKEGLVWLRDKFFRKGKVV